MIGILGGMGTQAGLTFVISLQFYIEEKLIKSIHYSFFIINQIFLVDLSQLVVKQKICQTDYK